MGHVTFVGSTRQSRHKTRWKSRSATRLRDVQSSMSWATARVEHGPGAESVATYVLLTKVTAAGVKTLQANPRRIKEVNKEIEALGARVIAQYATLGRYDFVNIVEAKDNESIARISVGLGARGTVQIETLTAIPVETFIRTIGRKTK